MQLIFIYCYSLCMHYSYCLIHAELKNRNDNVQEWVMIFQIIFSKILNKMKNWFINYVGFTAAYTSNGRQKTAEDDLQEFLSKSPIASRSNEPGRLGSYLLRLFLQSDIHVLLLYTYIPRIYIFQLTECRAIQQIHLSSQRLQWKIPIHQCIWSSLIYE